MKQKTKHGAYFNWYLRNVWRLCIIVIVAACAIIAIVCMWIVNNYENKPHLTINNLICQKINASTILSSSQLFKWRKTKIITYIHILVTHEARHKHAISSVTFTRANVDSKYFLLILQTISDDFELLFIFILKCCCCCCEFLTNKNWHHNLVLLHIYSN